MLNARNVIVAAVALAVVSLVAGCASLLLSSPGGGGWGRDSYGVRGDGLKGIYDTLQQLGVDVERQLFPAPAADDHDATFVLWAPLDSLVQGEPAHLQPIADWLHAGGHVVVTPTNIVRSLADSSQGSKGAGASKDSKDEPIDVLAKLGLADVALVESDVPLKGLKVDSPNKSSQWRPWRPIAERWVQAIPSHVRHVAVDCRGRFKQWQGITRLSLPADESYAIEFAGAKPLGRVTCADAEGRERTLAAVFPVGAGELTVVAIPGLASNAQLGQRDNSVLAARLLLGNRRRVVFDEFYHGLVIRGNALWLLTQRPYATMAVALVTVVGCWIWRRAVFLGPPQPDPVVSRRSIGEYLDAMSRFLMRSRRSGQFVLRELRGGALWLLGEPFGLPPDQDNAERLQNALSRSDPHRAQQLSQALAAADAVLAEPRAGNAAILEALKKVNACLSN